MDLGHIKAEYDSHKPHLERFLQEFSAQLATLLDDAGVNLGLEIETRVKTWESVEEKLYRKKIALHRITDLDDLSGIRITLLFLRDVERTMEVVRANMRVLSAEDAQDRLQPDEFGYLSRHLVVGMPMAWAEVPSLKPFGGTKAELQIRTLSQHIWATASHVLQYKHEANIPEPIRRTIHRLSAVLEIVDLELDRIIEERHRYLEHTSITDPDTPLNTDTIAKLMDELLPADCRQPDEPYGYLVDDLSMFGVVSAGRFRDIVSRNLSDSIEDERSKAARWGRQSGYRSQAALVEDIMCHEFGDRWRMYNAKR